MLANHRLAIKLLLITSRKWSMRIIDMKVRAERTSALCDIFSPRKPIGYRGSADSPDRSIIHAESQAYHGMCSYSGLLSSTTNSVNIGIQCWQPRGSRKEESILDWHCVSAGFRNSRMGFLVAGAHPIDPLESNASCRVTAELYQ